MSELQALLARVEAATGEDQRDLLLAAGEYLVPYGQQEDGGYAWWSLVIGYIDAGAYTDAALALVERALPEANCVGFDKTPNGCDGYVSRNNVSTGHWLVERRANTPALSICAALLSALLSTEAQPSVCEQGEQGNPVEDEP